MFGLHAPIPGGSEYLIEYEGPKTKEVITIYLPPVGYTIDRIPDPKTGKPTYDLIPCEILGSDLPVPEQKWIKPRLPDHWKKWRGEEQRQQVYNKNWIHPEAEKFRAREWTRRVNGCWQALGNRNGHPTEPIYIPPSAYYYFGWWPPDFGAPKFRLVYLKTFLTLQWAEDHPKVRGVVLSTHRRHGKTSMAGSWTVDLPSRMDFGYGGMQGQAGKKAQEFFEIHLMQPFRNLVDFFQPRFDPQSSLKTQLLFSNPIPRSMKRRAEEQLAIEDGDSKILGGRITCVMSSETALDGKKLHRIWLDEPGKWEAANIYSTVLKYIPCTSNELRKKIGLLFVPSTVEEIEKGGAEFIKLFENSVPSLMQVNPNGKTTTELVALFIPAYEGILFEEYGRSVVDDPNPMLITLDEEGNKITEGAKTILTKERLSKQGEEDRIEEIRKYPWSWFEAKMSTTFKCQFNAQILIARLQQLQSMRYPPYVRGNYQWKDEVDGDVIFVRDDVAGRFKVAWVPDEKGGDVEGNKKVINNVGIEWNENKKIFIPRNDRLFAAGADPIAYKAKGIDPRLSNGGAHIFRKFDPTVDGGGKPMDEWESYNFVVQYLFRPDTFEMYGEDMIKMVRYWGCSINAEDNVQALRQYFDSRGYGAFIMYRRDFDNPSIMGNGDMDRPMRSNNEVIDHYTSVLNTWFFRHGMRGNFAEMYEQGLQFDPNSTQKFDCIVSAGYTLIGASKRYDSFDDGDEKINTGLFVPSYSADGWKKTG